MPNYDLRAEEWFYLIESQINEKLPNRLELLPGLRARFGNLLREDIVSVVLVSDGKSHLMLVSALCQSLVEKQINDYIPSHLLNSYEQFELSSLLPIAAAWVDALDGFDGASEFELFTPPCTGIN